MRYRTFAPLCAAVALLVSVPLLVAPALARQEPAATPALEPVYMEAIPLRYTDPVAIAKSINSGTLPEGTRLVKADPKVKRSLRVVGTQDAITAIKGIVTLLDVAPRKITALVAVERVRFMADGKKTATLVTRKTLNAVTNVANDFAVTDTTGAMVVVAVTPRLSQVAGTDDTVFVRMGVRNAKGSTVGMERATTLPKKQQTKRLIGATFSDDSATLNAVGTGTVPEKWKTAFTAYYVSIQILPKAATKP